MTRLLAGIGIDAEQVARFDKLAAGAKPWRHVYSPREAEHLIAQPRAALALCASFCCKEALYKAVGGFYAFPDVEIFYRPGVREQEIVVSSAFSARHGLAEIHALFDERFLAGHGEFVAEVRIRGAGEPGAGGAQPTVRGAAGEAGTGVSRLAAITIDSVIQERTLLEERWFSRQELAALGRRGVQSLAGALALKRALAALLAAAGFVTVQPRDFELEHLDSGAPRVIAAPEAVSPSDLLVSISHTRQWAYGLAALAAGTVGR